MQARTKLRNGFPTKAKSVGNSAKLFSLNFASVHKFEIYSQLQNTQNKDDTFHFYRSGRLIDTRSIEVFEVVWRLGRCLFDWTGFCLPFRLTH